MISTLFGMVRSLSTDRVVIEVGGVGLLVTITPLTSARLTIGQDVQLFTSLTVREDSLTLFGFFDENSRLVFDLVQTVTGIGPKVAMSILSIMSPDELSAAIASENVAAIERVPGIGRKGAQRVILELKGKITFAHGTSINHLPAWRDQLSSALVSLGYSPKDADATVGSLRNALQESGEDPAQMEMSDLLKRCLQSAGAGRRL